MIPGKILGMASLPQGLLVCTDVAIYLCDEQNMTLVANYGVVPGSPIARLPDGSVLIHTVRGECAAMPFVNLTERKCSFAPGSQCSTAIVNQGGEQRLVVLTDGLGKPFNAAF